MGELPLQRRKQKYLRCPHREMARKLRGPTSDCWALCRMRSISQYVLSGITIVSRLQMFSFDIAPYSMIVSQLEPLHPPAAAPPAPKAADIIRYHHHLQIYNTTAEEDADMPVQAWRRPRCDQRIRYMVNNWVSTGVHRYGPLSSAR